MNTIVKNVRIMVVMTMMIGLSSILVYSLMKNQEPPEVVPAQFEQEKQKAGATEEVYEVNGPLTVTVKLQREFIDGEISVETKKETIWSMEDFWARYADWQMLDQKQDEVVFKQKINDISPLTKANGYFGISEDGTLTIFNGHPQGEKAIHSFFQIDVGKLESRQHEKLKDGIPVGTKDNYVQVIETFKHYEKSPEREPVKRTGSLFL